MRIIAAILIVLSSNAFGQSSMQDQISSVSAVQKRIRDEEQSRRDAAAEAEKERQRQSFELAQKKIEGDQKNEKARIDLERARAAKAAQASAKRQAYEDELRAIEIQERKASLDMKKARANRANEYVDRELKRDDASTDVIKSKADANRNLSEGGRDMMKGIGKGAEKKSFW